jgi:4-hydroxybenzoate polyprenyltransferase
LLNDLLDLPHDRLHATKRRRPFASGALNIAQAPPLMLACLAAAVAFSLWLPPRFLLMLGVYYVCTLTYSLGLKRLAVWDVMMLAGLYTLRVFVGSAATAILISPWLLAFSLFLFFCRGETANRTRAACARGPHRQAQWPRLHA